MCGSQISDRHRHFSGGGGRCQGIGAVRAFAPASSWSGEHACRDVLRGTCSGQRHGIFGQPGRRASGDFYAAL